MVGEPRDGAVVQFLGTWVFGQQLHLYLRCGGGHPPSSRPRVLIGERTLPVHEKVATSTVLFLGRGIWSPCRSLKNREPASQPTTGKGEIRKEMREVQH